ncbi:MAG TPA: TlyA family RNA methyltransferase [Solirubrobacteraceae bacterium]|nr:TlyA family RNA methyltransferase [Solirubrobacteraceae bacterium]
MSKVRLDALLQQRGLFESRSRAAAFVLAGRVRLGNDRRRAQKPGQLVTEDVTIDVEQAPDYVSRGGRKLANALTRTGVSVAGRRCLDIGASTGGFTDCLLQSGAAQVVAVDVAYGELHWQLRQDPRVTPLERRNARTLRPGELPWAADVITVDVSFISLTKVLPAVLSCAAPQFDCLALVKPQFEVGRELIARGGVVRDAGARRDALLAVAAAATDLGVAVQGFASSGLPGPKGNLETFIWLAEAGRGAVADVEAAVREVEP